LVVPFVFRGQAQHSIAASRRGSKFYRTIKNQRIHKTHVKPAFVISLKLINICFKENAEAVSLISGF
jgi:hypothetical protein